MTTRSRIIVLGAVGALLTAVLLYELVWKQPSYQGVSLSDWLAKSDNARPEEQLKVIDAVQHMGPRALPWLFEMLHARDSPGRQQVVDFLNEYASISLRPWEPAERLRRRALPALVALRSRRSKIIVQHLTQELRQASSAGDVAPVLALMGTNALPPLLRALTNTAAEVRWNAATALSFPAEVSRQTNAIVLRLLAACGITQDELRLNSKAFSLAAVPSLLRCLTDPDPQVRRLTINSLERMGERSTNAIPILIADLSSPEAQNRRFSADLLSAYGKAAEEAVPALVKALNDSDESVRNAVLRALKLIDPRTAEDYSPESVHNPAKPAPQFLEKPLQANPVPE
jgi:HEAT repeat protein